MRLWSDKARTLDPPVSRAAPWYQTLDSLRGSDWDAIRRTFESWLDCVPPQHQGEVVHNFKSEEPHQCHAAVTELFVARWLCDLGYHLDLCDLGGRNPDYLVSDPEGNAFILEVTTLNDAPDVVAQIRRNNQLLDSIDRAAARVQGLPPIALHASFWKMGEVSLAVRSQIGSVHDWLRDIYGQSFRGSRPQTTLWFLAKQGDSLPEIEYVTLENELDLFVIGREFESQDWDWVISLAPIPLDPSTGPEVRGRIGVSGRGQAFQLAEPRINDAVLKKVRKYRSALKRVGLPFVVVVGNAEWLGSSHDFGMLDSIFNGSITHHLDSNLKTLGFTRRANGLWVQGSRVSELNGVLALNSAGWETAQLSLDGASWNPALKQSAALERIRTEVPEISNQVVPNG